jgi:hypothetical protein
VIFNGTAMDDGIMADAYTITNDGLGFLVCTVENCAVLDIDLIADPDGVHIAPDYGIEPDTAVISNDYVTYHGGIGSDKTVFTELGMDTFDGQNYRHGNENLTIGKILN